MLKASRFLGDIARSFFGSEHLWTALLAWVIIAGVCVIVANVFAMGV